MDNVSNYSFNGSEALAESREDYRFYERFVDVNGNKIYEPVEVTDVCVMIYKIEKPDITYASDSYYLTAKCFSEICGDYTLRYCIAKKQYLDFINDKNGNYRLELLLQYSKGDLFVRKVRARVHIDVRMRNELYKQIELAIPKRNAASHGVNAISLEECKTDKRIVLSDLESIRNNTLGLVMLFLSLFKAIN